MGNGKSTAFVGGGGGYVPIVPEKSAQWIEVTSPEYTVDRLYRYSAYGDTANDALIALRKVCLHHGVPVPEKHPESGKYHCGQVRVYHGFKVVKRLNPVWIDEQNGRYLASCFYTKL